ncbi:MAG TPA: DNA-directed RNA polymerase subunit omega [Nitrospirae bacterium]|nr:DNA-directed RNA polymerase subunit omega [Nitrospirota bacterium]
MIDIISLPVEFDREQIDGRFRLVNIAAQRAKELASGAEPKITSKANKVSTLAIQEAILGRLEFLTGEEAVKAREEAKKIDFRRVLEDRRKELEVEDLSELEKDLQVYMHEKEEASSSDESIESEE